MFKRISVAVATLAASSAFVFPIQFSAPSQGCSDSSYRYATLHEGGRYDSAAATAKAGFCRVNDDYNRMYN